MIRSRNFGPYFVGNAASASGTWFQNLAGSILVFRLTHSAFLLGVLAFCQFAPVLLLAPWAGSWADRFDRRKLILGSQLAAIAFSGGLAALAWDGHATAWVVIGCSAALGVTSAVSAPAQQALITSLVDASEVAQAVALNSMTFNLAARDRAGERGGRSSRRSAFLGVRRSTRSRTWRSSPGLLAVQPAAAALRRRGRRCERASG